MDSISPIWTVFTWSWTVFQQFGLYSYGIGLNIQLTGRRAPISVEMMATKDFFEHALYNRKKGAY